MEMVSAMSNVRLSRRHLFGTAALGSAAGYLALSGSPLVDELIGGSFAADPDLGSTNSIDSKPGTFPIRILFNENPLGCSPLARDAAIKTLESSHFYPFETAAQLTAKLRARHGLPLLPQTTGLSLRGLPEAGDHSLVLAGGSSELLLAFALAFSVDGGNLIEPEPSYQSVGSTTQARPGKPMELRRIPLGSDGNIDTDAMIAACDGDTQIMVITNPNNPTGACVSKEKIENLVNKVPSHVKILVDEAYIDFLDDAESHSVIPLALQKDNVLVTRTFSKIHGLAGLRAGYGIGHKTLFEQMRPFQVGSLSLNACGLSAAMASLNDSDFQAKSRTMAAESRGQIRKELMSLGFQVSDSKAACLWVDFGRDSSPIVQALADRGILISSGMRWNSPTCARISVGTKWQTKMLLQAINDVV